MVGLARERLELKIVLTRPDAAGAALDTLAPVVGTRAGARAVADVVREALLEAGWPELPR